MRARIRTWLQGSSAAFVVLVATSRAAADPVDRDRDRDRDRQREAERLFDEARAFQRQGKRDEACVRFEASEKLDPAVGTLLNLAECAERVGATARAWHRYREAAALATERNDTERLAVATRRGEAIEARLSKLVVRTQAPLPASGTVWRDDEIVLASELGVPLAVDPGPHRLTVRAPGYVTWTRAITIDRGPTTLEIELPALVPAAASPPLAPSPAAASPSEATAARPTRLLPVVLGAAGLATVAVGSWFALRARSTWQEVDARCPAGACPDASTVTSYGPEQQSAARDARIGTVFLVTGGVAILVAAGLYVLGRDAHAP